MTGMSEKTFEAIAPDALKRLVDIVGDRNLVTSEEDMEPYSRDETEDLRFMPEAVAKPATAEEVSRIMKLASAARFPVTPRGGGTGLSGGALPVHGGLVLSTERMKTIEEIDERNLTATAAAGVVTEELQNEVEKRDLFYPPDPASRGSCTLGGNVAECAGGPRALKYGVTGDYVLGVEAVLPDGTTLRTGKKLYKDAAGYNLTRLLSGSEGTLAVVTRVILRLLPLPVFRRTLLVPFDSIEKAAGCVRRLFMNRIVPCSAEFMDRQAVELAENKLGRKAPVDPGEALLLLEVDGSDLEALQREYEKMGGICLEAGANDVLVAESSEKQNLMWDIRRAVGEAVKAISVYKEEDTVVPPAELPELVSGIRDVARAHGIIAVCYGHAGDGNIHCNILKGGMSDERWRTALPAAVREIHGRAVALGGSITGEHGVGFTQKPFLTTALSQAEIALMKRIKNAFDPLGILNPGKIFPD
ncbi:MAG: FAD-linked oxidase C-terminal domain-containing protein [bacterium]